MQRQEHRLTLPKGSKRQDILAHYDDSSDHTDLLKQIQRPPGYLESTRVKINKTANIRGKINHKTTTIQPPKRDTFSVILFT